MSELLRMEHISKRFGSFYANKDISLTVNCGEVLTLLGENGAGKSTLMNILIGLYQPTEGKIFLKGKETATSPQPRREAGHRRYTSTSCWWKHDDGVRQHYPG